MRAVETDESESITTKTPKRSPPALAQPPPNPPETTIATPTHDLRSRKTKPTSCPTTPQPPPLAHHPSTLATDAPTTRPIETPSAGHDEYELALFSRQWNRFRSRLGSPGLFLAPRVGVRSIIHSHQMFDGHVRITLRRRQTAVSQQLLNGSKISSPAQHVCGTGMPKRMRMHVRPSRTQCAVLMHQCLYPTHPHSLSPLRQKQRFVVLSQGRMPKFPSHRQVRA